MRRTAAGWAVAGALLQVAVAGCSVPPPEAFVQGSRRVGKPLELGRNQFGEACTLVRVGNRGEVFCGSHVEPAGHVTAGATAAEPAEALAASPWRRSLDQRFACAEPRSTQVGGVPGYSLACTRRQGGWPHVGLAVRIDGTTFLADGVQPADAALRRAVDVMAGRAPAVEAAAADDSGLDTRRQAASTAALTGAGAIAEVDFQIQRGGAENRRANYAAAESAYRTALAIQERQLGPDNPALALTLARLALQVSNQGRGDEAVPLMARAARLAARPDQPDPLTRPLVTYLQALLRLNAGQAAEALALLDQAETAFAALVPPELLVTRSRPIQVGRSAVEQMVATAADVALLANPTVAEALNALIETRRYRAVALKTMGRVADAEAALAASRELYVGRDPRLLARYLRTAGVTVGSSGQPARAASDLGAAVDLFSRVQPGSIPLAQTQLLQAGELVAAGRPERALSLCRSAAQTLQGLRAGLPPTMFEPCLRAFSVAGAADRADLRAEMFMVAQLAQGSITARQIARAAARQAEGQGNPAVAEAMRQQDLAGRRLDLLYLRRAELPSGRERSGEAAAIDAEISAVQDTLRDAGQAIQTAAPRLSGLVQETASVDAVRAVLGQDEALAAVVLGETEGWTFLIRRTGLTMGRIEGGAGRVDALVRRIRATMDPDAANRPPPFDNVAAADLYAAVLGPVAADLAGVRNLTVAPTGSLLSVPFGLLLTGPAAGDALAQAPFLVRRMAVAHVPSPGGFVNLRRAAPAVRASRPWFGFGDFRPPTLRQARATFPADGCGDSGRMLAALSPLAGARRELEAARTILGASSADQMLGAAFTAPNVLAAQLADFRMLHFATHAVLPSELRCQAEPAVLASTAPGAPDARGAMLTASQIERMQLDADLVILAACNTAGPAGSGSGAGESLSGLARSFFFAGARALLVTHWEANDATTTYLTALFLQALQADRSAGAAAALATAQRRMLDEAVGARAAQAHPYYWAVEALIGGSAPAAAGVVGAAGGGTGGGPGGA